jgi:hypothetical protein
MPSGKKKSSKGAERRELWFSTGIFSPRFFPALFQHKHGIARAPRLPPLARAPVSFPRSALCPVTLSPISASLSFSPPRHRSQKQSNPTDLPSATTIWWVMSARQGRWPRRIQWEGTTVWQHMGLRNILLTEPLLFLHVLVRAWACWVLSPPRIFHTKR